MKTGSEFGCDENKVDLKQEKSYYSGRAESRNTHRYHVHDNFARHRENLIHFAY